MTASGIETWGNVAARDAAEATAWLRPFLVEGERIEVVFRCGSWSPFMSVAILTNLRIVGVPEEAEWPPMHQAARSMIRNVRGERRKLRHALIVELPGNAELVFAGVVPEVSAQLARRLAHERLGVGAPHVDPHDLAPTPAARADVAAIESVVGFGVPTLGIALVWASPLGLVVSIAASAVLGLIAFSCLADVISALRYRVANPMRMSDADFNSLVMEVEAAGRRSQPDPHDPEDFDLLVEQALDELPPFMREALDNNVAVIISDQGEEHAAYGLYHGDGIAFDTTADRIVIFRDTLIESFGDDPDVLREQVRITVLHELAHHLGADENKVRDLGL